MHSRTFEKLFASRHSQRAKYRREGCRCTRERRAGPACACPRASTSGPLKLISRFINGQLPHLFFSPPFPSLPLTGSHVASLLSFLSFFVTDRIYRNSEGIGIFCTSILIISSLWLKIFLDYGYFHQLPIFFQRRHVASLRFLFFIRIGYVEIRRDRNLLNEYFAVF